MSGPDGGVKNASISRDDLVYHRSLDGAYQKFPYETFLKRQEVFEHAGAFTAFILRGSSLVPMMALQKKDQNFATYATAWEKLHSKLVVKSFPMEPIVDGDMMVVGHVGWINQAYLYAPTAPYYAALKAVDDAAEQARKSPYAPPREKPLQEDILPFVPIPIAKPEVASAEYRRTATRRMG